MTDTLERRGKIDGLRSPEHELSGEVTPAPPSKATQIRQIVDSPRYHEIFDEASPTRPFAGQLAYVRNFSNWSIDSWRRAHLIITDLVPEVTENEEVVVTLKALFDQAWLLQRDPRNMASNRGINNYEDKKREILALIEDDEERKIAKAAHESIVEKGIYPAIDRRLGL